MSREYSIPLYLFVKNPPFRFISILIWKTAIVPGQNESAPGSTVVYSQPRNESHSTFLPDILVLSIIKFLPFRKTAKNATLIICEYLRHF